MERETAMKILKELHDNSLFSNRTALETLIPELAYDNDERIRKDIIAYIKKANSEPNNVLPSGSYCVLEMITWLQKQGEQKQEWSETDENRFQNIIACIEDCYNEKDAQDLIRWFKSLRHQPKPVWSKVDIKMLQLIIDGYQNTEDFSKVDGVFVDWLKSLKDRMEGKEG